MVEDLPEWVEDRLEHDNNRRLQQRHVAEIIVNGDRPYYNVRRIRAELKGDFDNDTVRSRLNELVEQDVLATEMMNRGNIYWLKDDDSDWPIPPDVEVVPVDDELTVSEFFSQPYVAVASLGAFFAVVSGIVIWVALLQDVGAISYPLSTQTVLQWGLLLILVSLVFISASGVLWIAEKTFGSFDKEQLPNWLSKRGDQG